MKKRTQARILSLAVVGIAVLAGCSLFDTSIAISDITTATTFQAGKVYLIDGTVTVSAKLTLEPGTTVKFKKYSNYGSLLAVDATGQIDAEGTADKRIVFTSSNVGGTTAPAAGDWGGVVINGSHCAFAYCDFKYSGNGDQAALEIDSSDCTVSNCLFTDNALAIDADGAGENTALDGNAIYGNTGGASKQYAAIINANVALSDTNKFQNDSGSLKNTCQGISLYGNLNATQTLACTGAPYVVDGVPQISALLTINPGVTVKFTTYSNYGSGFTVGSSGSIHALGSEALPITFTCLKDGSDMTPARKDWGNIYLEDGANSQFSHCAFRYSGNGDVAALDLHTATASTVTDCAFEHNFYGISAFEAEVGTTISGNTFSDNLNGDFVPNP